MRRPPLVVLAIAAAITATLVSAHLAATHGDGHLDDPELAHLSVTPANALGFSPHLLWAGFFHFSWQHLGYNLALFAVAFPLATQGRGPWAPWTTLVGSMVAATVTVLALPAVVIRPLAGLGVDYAADALGTRLVGASIGIYAIAGAGLASLPRRIALPLGSAGVLAEVIAAFLGTRPFVFAFHLTGMALGYGARWLADFAKERTASVFASPALHSSSRLRRAFSGRSGQSTHFGSASQQAMSRSRGGSEGQLTTRGP